MAEVYNVIIFKDITAGFMNIDEILDIQNRIDKKSIRDKLCFCLMNSATLEKNQTIMQMFNGLIGFDIFKYAVADDKLVKYKFLQDNQLRKENITAEEFNFDDFENFLKNDLKQQKLKFTIIENEIFKNLKKII